MKNVKVLLVWQIVTSKDVDMKEVDHFILSGLVM